MMSSRSTNKRPQFMDVFDPRRSDTRQPFGDTVAGLVQAHNTFVTWHTERRKVVGNRVIHRSHTLSAIMDEATEFRRLIDFVWPDAAKVTAESLATLDA